MPVGLIQGRLILRTLIGSIRSAVVKVISRYFITFDPLVNTYGVLSKPIVFTGDFEIEGSFSTLSTSVASVIIGNDSDANPNIRTSASGVMAINLPGGVSGSMVVNDGKLHHFKLKVVGESVIMEVDGVVDIDTTLTPSAVIWNLVGKNFFGNYFNGKIADLKLSGDGVPLTNLILDKAPPTDLYEYGVDVISNSAFSDSSDWVLFSATISGGEVTIAGSENGYFAQDVVVSLGSVVELTYTVTSTSVGGTLYLSSTGFGDVSTPIGKSVGTHKEYIRVLDPLAPLKILQNTDDSISLTNIHIKEVTNFNTVQANKNIIYTEGNTFGDNVVVNGDFSDGFSDWVVTEGGQTVEIVDGRLHIVTDGSSCGVRQPNGITGVTVEVSFDYEAVSGSLKAQVGSLSFPVTETGHYTYTTTGANSNIYLYRNSGDGDGYFSNYKVREIQGNALTMKGLYPDQQNKYTLTSDGWLADAEIWTFGAVTSDGADSAFAQLTPNYPIVEAGLTYVWGATASGLSSGGMQIRNAGIPLSITENGFSSNILDADGSNVRVRTGAIPPNNGATILPSVKRLIEVI